jgi:UDP-N-acetylmuramoylalanine--D-glutamate ligase
LDRQRAVCASGCLNLEGAVIMDIAGKKIVVVGLAKSGVACARLLLSQGALVAVTENSNSPAVQEAVRALPRQGVTVETGSHTKEFLTGSSLVVVSPGVPETCPVFSWAHEFGIPLISEIELAYRFCKGTVVAVTGTNGKTTVTTLISKVLALSGRTVFTLGNIGTPFSGSVLDIGADDFAVVEISSFQLEHIVHFRPHVAVFLNFAPDHLDRYPDVGSYLTAKKRIFLNQTEDDFAVLNHEDDVVRSFASQIRSRAVYFNTGSDAYEDIGAAPLDANKRAVVAVAGIFQVTPRQCSAIFAQFRGIEHRMEFVRTVRGVDFINDSKATNVDSTLFALRNMTRPVVLIAGGKDKNMDYSLIKPFLNTRIKNVILIGQAAAKIRARLQGDVPLYDAATMPDAVALGLRTAAPGDCVLLSPMCSSYDMFDNFEHRGRIFKDAVLRLS